MDNDSDRPSTSASALVKALSIADAGSAIVVVSSLAGEELCRFAARRDGTWRDFVFALEAALKDKLDDSHVLIHGGEVLDGRASFDQQESGGMTFLATVASEDPVQLLLVRRQCPAVREATAAIHEAIDSQNDTALKNGLQTLAQNARQGDAESMDAIHVCIKHTKAQVRERALAALLKLAAVGNQSVIEVVVPLLGDAGQAVRSAAVRVVEKIARRGDQRVVEALLPLLGHANCDSRRDAVVALAKIAKKGDQHAIAAVAALFGDTAKRVPPMASFALEQIAEKGDQRAIEALVPQLALGGGDANARRHVLGTLAKIVDKGDERAMEAVLPLLGAPDWETRCIAVGAVAKIADKGDQRAIEEVVALFGDAVHSVRSTARSAFLQIAERGDRRTLEAVVSLLGHDEREVRLWAVEELSQLVGDHGGSGQLAARALAPLLCDESGQVRSAAVRALGQLAERGDQRAVEVLTPSLGDRSSSVQDEARQAIDKINAGDAEEVSPPIAGTPAIEWTDVEFSGAQAQAHSEENAPAAAAACENAAIEASGAAPSGAGDPERGAEARVPADSARQLLFDDDDDLPLP